MLLLPPDEDHTLLALRALQNFDALGERLSSKKVVGLENGVGYSLNIW